MRIGKNIIFAELSFKLNGILFAIHNQLGRYCNEKQYGDMLESLLKDAQIKYQREYTLPPSFQDEQKGRQKVDFIVSDEVIIEIKAKRIIEKSDYYQAVRYLRATNKKLALLVNFRDKYLKIKRILNSSL